MCSWSAADLNGTDCSERDPGRSAHRASRSASRRPLSASPRRVSALVAPVGLGRRERPWLATVLLGNASNVVRPAHEGTIRYRSFKGQHGWRSPMSRMSRRFTKQRTVLGVRIGRRRANWSAISKAGMIGAGAVSTVAGGLEARRRGLPGGMRKLPQELTGQLKKVTDQLGDHVHQLAGATPGEQARPRHDSAASAGSRRRREDTKVPRSQKPSASRKKPSASKTKASASKTKQAASRKQPSTSRSSSRSTRSANSTKRQPARAGRP